MKKSFFRGVLAGILTLLISLMVFAVLYVLFKMVAWPIISGVPYVRNPEPILVGSKEWYLLQPFALLSAILSGMAVARWSKPNSWPALLVILFIVLIFSIFSPVETDSVLNLAIWFLEVPIGLLMGFYFFNSRGCK
jgi:hypothetical protein